MTDPYTDSKEQKTLYAGERVDLTLQGGVAWVTINRPKAMNALNNAVIDQLTRAFHTAAACGDARGIVFRGAGKAFVAGADIRFFVDSIRSDRISDIEGFARKGHELFLALETSEKPTIALLDGLSLGGGSEMALACQAVITTPKGIMGFPETGIGIVPGLGGMLRTARRVGLPLAKYLVFSGAILKAKDMLDLGIATALVEPDDVDSAVDGLLRRPVPEARKAQKIPEKFQFCTTVFNDQYVEHLIQGTALPPSAPDTVQADFARVRELLAIKSPAALKMANEIMDAQDTMSVDAAVALELNQMEQIFGTHDALEGLTAAGMRKPRFTGA